MDSGFGIGCFTFGRSSQRGCFMHNMYYFFEETIWVSIMCKVVLRYSGEYGQQCKKRRARRNKRPSLGGRGIARSHR